MNTEEIKLLVLFLAGFAFSLSVVMVRRSIIRTRDSKRDFEESCKAIDEAARPFKVLPHQRRFVGEMGKLRMVMRTRRTRGCVFETGVSPMSREEYEAKKPLPEGQTFVDIERPDEEKKR